MADAPLSLAVSTVIFALRPHPRTQLPVLWVPLVRRIRQPHQGRWALPGGPLGAQEGLAAAAARTLQETTRLSPSYLEQLYAFGGLDRAPSTAERTVSIVYWALVRPEEADAGAVGVNVRWFVADELPELAFDHSLIVEYALWRLRNKVEYSRIAAAFLGESFTLAELRGVHEAVLQRRLDPANFRRQIEASGRLVATEEFRTGGRHRPARLYRHDHSIQLTDNGPLTES
ncbi:NUDIX domain-containing protein [Brachybacterium sp. EE-P12]|uniref:NUDIX domain-containing protein n=1 Tax=Candidatus Brachybacterium intestinipullorum TaxID=2838512 RepID=A0A9D2PZP0_9MICO|nr:NUDIX domain-containing protein [Brachybacterium sp. EE-P12]HJC68732.1 NUDIX domain-containing protein [Candidatus Brachybacterium intestinipullorum]